MKNIKIENKNIYLLFTDYYLNIDGTIYVYSLYKYNYFYYGSAPATDFFPITGKAGCNLLPILLPLNESNPAATIDRFNKLLLLT